MPTTDYRDLVYINYGNFSSTGSTTSQTISVYSGTGHSHDGINYMAMQYINGNNILPGSIDGTKLARDSVTNGNIQAYAVQEMHLSDCIITNRHIHDDELSPKKIANFNHEVRYQAREVFESGKQSLIDKLNADVEHIKKTCNKEVNDQIVQALRIYFSDRCIRCNSHVMNHSATERYCSRVCREADLASSHVLFCHCGSSGYIDLFKVTDAIGQRECFSCKNIVWVTGPGKNIRCSECGDRHEGFCKS